MRHFIRLENANEPYLEDLGDSNRGANSDADFHLSAFFGSMKVGPDGQRFWRKENLRRVALQQLAVSRIAMSQGEHESRGGTRRNQLASDHGFDAIVRIGPATKGLPEDGRPGCLRHDGQPGRPFGGRGLAKNFASFSIKLGSPVPGRLTSQGKVGVTDVIDIRSQTGCSTHTNVI